MELHRLERLAINNQGQEEFTVASLNVRSLMKHFEDVKHLIKNYIDVVCLQETWLPPSSNEDRYHVDNFDLTLNSVGSGKGIATYFKKNYNVVAEHSEPTLQISKVRSQHMDVINVYRSAQNTSLEERLLDILTPDRPTIITGDININVGGEKDASIVKTLGRLGFQQMVQKPTHDEGNTIDVVFVNNYLSDKVKVMQKSFGFTDHDLLLVRIDRPSS